MLLVVGTHTLGGRFERGAAIGGQASECFFQFVARQFEVGHRGGAEAVEAVAVVDHSGIAARLDVGQDGGDGALDGVVGGRLEGEQRFQFRRKVGVYRG